MRIKWEKQRIKWKKSNKIKWELGINIDRSEIEVIVESLHEQKLFI